LRVGLDLEVGIGQHLERLAARLDREQLVRAQGLDHQHRRGERPLLGLGQHLDVFGADADEQGLPDVALKR